MDANWRQDGNSEPCKRFENRLLLSAFLCVRERTQAINIGHSCALLTEEMKVCVPVCVCV